MTVSLTWMKSNMAEHIDRKCFDTYFCQTSLCQRWVRSLISDRKHCHSLEKLFLDYYMHIYMFTTYFVNVADIVAVGPTSRRTFRLPSTASQKNVRIIRVASTSPVAAATTLASQSLHRPFPAATVLIVSFSTCPSRRRVPGQRLSSSMWLRPDRIQGRTPGESTTVVNERSLPAPTSSPPIQRWGSTFSRILLL